MASMLVGGAVLGATIETFVVLNRVFHEADAASEALSEQERMVDYIARDLREALVVTPSDSNQTLTLQIPDSSSAYDAQCNPIGVTVTPVISGGKVVYNNATYDINQFISVKYYLYNQQLYRYVSIPRTGQSATMMVSSKVTNLQSFIFPTLSGSYTNNVTIKFTCNPQFDLSAGMPGHTSSPSTTMTETIAVRSNRWQNAGGTSSGS